MPNPDFLYFSSKHEEALTRLVYAAQGRKGAAMLTGDPGMGKTTLTRAFIRQLDEKRYDIGLVANPSLEPVDFIKEILYQLDVQSDSTSKVDLLRLLNEKMLSNIQKDMDTIVIVDEAQAIENEKTLEELRMLLNFQMNDRFLLTLILVGQPELQAKVESIPQLSQRISIKYHLSLSTIPTRLNSYFSASRWRASKKVYSLRKPSRTYFKCRGASLGASSTFATFASSSVLPIRCRSLTANWWIRSSATARVGGRPCA
ncbi:MAG: AAA family ATPase [Nitrospinaceae bacterium]|nr:AAA family ATPase [Nitrospinaceae bacterium]